MSNLIEKLGNTDKLVFCTINKRTRCSTLDIFMPLFTQLGSAEFTISIVLLMYLFGGRFMDGVALMCALSLSSSHLAAHIIKRAVNRPRPWQSIEGIDPYNFNLIAYSFPSGHTTAAFSIGIVLALCMAQLSGLFFLVSSLVGLSRIYLGVHYPSDVLAGCGLGTIAAYSSYNLLSFML